MRFKLEELKTLLSQRYCRADSGFSGYTEWHDTIGRLTDLKQAVSFILGEVRRERALAKKNEQTKTR